jgi:hypothetical protein
MWVARPQRTTEIQINPQTQPSWLTNLKIPKFKDDGTFPWEEFESIIEMRTNGKTETYKIELLQQSLGTDVLAWYTGNRLAHKSFMEQLTALRKYYSKHREGETGIGMPHRILWQAGDNIRGYNLRVNRACLHMIPRAFLDRNDETLADRAKRWQEHVLEEQAYKLQKKNAFVNGLPHQYQQRLFNRQELLKKPLEEIVDRCQAWESAAQRAKEGALANRQSANIELNSAKAQVYHAQRNIDSDDEDWSDPETDDDEKEPLFVGLANEILNNSEGKPKKRVSIGKTTTIEKAVDNQLKKEREQKNLQSLVAKMSQFESKIDQIETATGKKLAEQLTAEMDKLPAMMKDMLIKDAKPVAKAGTKGDPTIEQADEAHEANQRRRNNNRGNYRGNDNQDYRNNNRGNYRGNDRNEDNRGYQGNNRDRDSRRNNDDYQNDRNARSRSNDRRNDNRRDRSKDYNDGPENNRNQDRGANRGEYNFPGRQRGNPYTRNNNRNAGNSGNNQQKATDPKDQKPKQRTAWEAVEKLTEAAAKTNEILEKHTVAYANMMESLSKN